MQIKSKELYTYMHKYSMQHNHTVYTGLSTTSASSHKLENQNYRRRAALAARHSKLSQRLLSLCLSSHTPGVSWLYGHGSRGRPRWIQTVRFKQCRVPSAESRPPPSPALPPSRVPRPCAALGALRPSSQTLVAGPRRQPSSQALRQALGSQALVSAHRLRPSG